MSVLGTILTKVAWQPVALKAWDDVVKKYLTELVVKTTNPWDDYAVEMIDKAVQRLLSNKFILD